MCLFLETDDTRSVWDPRHINKVAEKIGEMIKRYEDQVEANNNSLPESSDSAGHVPLKRKVCCGLQQKNTNKTTKTKTTRTKNSLKRRSE